MHVTPLSKQRSRPLAKKPRRLTCSDHLAYLATLPCAACGARPVTIHHLRCQGSTAAAGRRAGDHEAVGLCHAHHQGDAGVHKLGERAFWALHGIDPLALAARLWAESRGNPMP